MKGKTVVVTGGNSGIGFETARNLAEQGARVLIASRNVQKADIAVEQIIKSTGNDQVERSFLELSDLDSVVAFADQAKKKLDKIDVLINNAGLMSSDFKQTKQGFELQFGVNHLGHFLLTILLTPLLCQSSDPRVINVSSSAHYSGKMRYDLIRENPSKYSPMAAYSQSKLCNVLFTRGMAVHFPCIQTHALHPGVVGTSFGNKGLTGMIPRIWTILKPFLWSANKGSATSVYLATIEKVPGENGQYFHSNQAIKAPCATAMRDEEVEKLWAYSLEAVLPWMSAEDYASFSSCC